MLSNQQVSKFGKTIGFKIAAGYSFLFACSFLVLTIFAYLLLESTLIRQDRIWIETEVQSLQSQHLAGGWTAFHDKVIENDRFRKNNPFFTRVLQSPESEEIVFFTQYWKDFDLAALEAIAIQAPGQWMTFPNRMGTYDLEIFTAPLPDGTLMQVGISTEDRLAILQRFKESFLSVSIPLILLAAGGGALLSHRALMPLRNLILAVASIDAGKMDARVCVKHTGDELDEMGKLFNRMIEKINQLISGMKESLDSVAHDLRTPMTRFRNIAETALQQDPSEGSYREALQECLEESDRVMRKLNLLMDISEAETGTLSLQIQPVDMVRLAEEAVEMYRYIAEEKNISIVTDFTEAAPLEADADRVCQILANLLDNAVKFTDFGGRIQVSVKNLPEKVQIRVADTGIGIDPEEIHRIWERLFRGAHATYKGLGLGLSLVRAVVRAHKGDIEVTSTPGLGSVFLVELPTHR